MLPLGTKGNTYLHVFVVYIYTVVEPPTGICAECLSSANYIIADVLVVHTWTLYYTHNNLQPHSDWVPIDIHGATSADLQIWQMIDHILK